MKFQRTRGVLRLMAAVIHCLWEKGDRNPLILPSTIPIDDARVQFELTRYLSDDWAPIIEKDVDGPNSLPLRIDGEQPNLGRLHAHASSGAHDLPGLRADGRRGASWPGRSPRHAWLRDAWRAAGRSSAMRFVGSPARRRTCTRTGLAVWYATQPTVTKLAEDRAEQLKREPDKVYAELDDRIRDDVRKAGDFVRVHAFARSAADVPDDQDARLVVLPAEHEYTKDGTSAAEVAAKTLMESRGNSPRLFRNSLVFLAADKARMQDLDDAVRRYLAWKSIVDEADVLDLGKHQRGQAETQLKRRRVHGARADSRDLPVASRSHASESAGAGHLSGDASFRERCARRPRQQEAEERRASDHIVGSNNLEEASGRCAPLA